MKTHLNKIDCRGRVWRSAEVRRMLMEEFRAGELSVTEFCSVHGIHQGTFYGWLAKVRKVEVVPTFREVQVAMSSAARDVRISLPKRVEVFVLVDSAGSVPWMY